MDDLGLLALVTPLVVGVIQALKFLNLPLSLWRPTALAVGVGLVLAAFLESAAQISVISVAGAVVVGIEAGLAAWGTYDLGKNLTKTGLILTNELDT